MDKEKITLGTVINKLKIISYCDRPEDNDKYKDYGGPWVRCECSCGNEIVAPLYGIEKELIKSCGCFKGQQGAKVLKKYYKTHDPVNSNYLTIDGVTRNISEWSKITGVPRTTILYRLSKNVPLDKLFNKESDDNETNGDKS